MTKNDVMCRVWATEVSPRGHHHRCHAQHTGLDGHSYPKEEIQKILESKPTWGGTWEMRACDPDHDGLACEKCQYKPWKGLSHYYDLKQQREVLMEARNRGADIRVID